MTLHFREDFAAHFPAPIPGTTPTVYPGATAVGATHPIPGYQTGIIIPAEGPFEAEPGTGTVKESVIGAMGRGPALEGARPFVGQEPERVVVYRERGAMWPILLLAGGVGLGLLIARGK